MPFYLLHREDLAGVGWELRTRARNEGDAINKNMWFFVWLLDCALIIPSGQLSIQNPTNIRVTFHNYVPTCLYENGCLIQCRVDLDIPFRRKFDYFHELFYSSKPKGMYLLYRECDFVISRLRGVECYNMP